jgi:subtilase family serine protease
VVDPAPVKTAAGYELPAGGPLLKGGGEEGGYAPQDIQAAYRIPTSEGSGQTVAVIDAFGDTSAQSDLARYRERYGLEPCTKANGCFRKVNEQGEEGNYPPPGPGFELYWQLETALDMQMVSAACPHCHILLVQASTQYAADTGASVDTAVRLGATETSSSYAYPENYRPWCGQKGCAQYRSDYEHPDVPMTAASGDSGYRDGGAGVSFPAAAPSVIAVGGTNLYPATNSRGWREEAWEETGSGCSDFEPKPTGQSDQGCTKRTTNDVAAVSGCKTPVSVYWGRLGWTNVCGTSVATPIIAGVEAHATFYTQSLGPFAFYEDPGALFDVTSGSNGTCKPAYLCTAGVGYDGPTGLGTPDGVPFVHPPY